MTQTVSPSLASWLAADNNDVAKSAAIAYFQGLETLLTRAREVLTANRTYYVRTDGSDSNTGLANTAGGAFLTIQKAIDTASGLDLATFNATISVADGTYAGAVVLRSYVGAGPITLQGNTTTPANVIISRTAGGHAVQASGVLGAYTLKGFKTQISGGFGYQIIAQRGSRITQGEWEFGASSSGDHIYCDTGAAITQNANYTISGGAGAHVNATTGGLITGQSFTATLTGTPAFSTCFALADRFAACILPSVTYSGAATGTRYLAQLNSVLYTGGGGASYFPGNSAGSTNTGGQYA
jgi:hypothetical protein